MKARHDYLNMLADIRDFLRSKNNGTIPPVLCNNFNVIAFFFGAEAGRSGTWCQETVPEENKQR